MNKPRITLSIWLCVLAAIAFASAGVYLLASRYVSLSRMDYEGQAPITETS